MAKSKPMKESELSALCDGQISDAVSYEESELSGIRDKALEYREGEMKDLPAETGKSSVVSYDVNDTIAWIKPGLLRIFLSSDRVVEFEPVGPGDEEYAEQATDYINHVFLKECKGYKVLLTAFDDGLGLGNGIIKHWWDKSPCVKVESFSGLSEDRFIELVSDDDVEVLEHTAYGDRDATFASASPNPGLIGGGVAGDAAVGGAVPGGLPAGDGQLEPDLGGLGPAGGGMVPQQLHDLKIKRTDKTGRIRLEALPPEELLIPRDAIAIDEEISGIGHARTATRSQLIKEGFKREEVEELPAFVEAVDETSKSARDGLRSWQGTANPDKSMEKVRIYEWFPLVDFDGDGVAERRRVIIGDRTENNPERKILLNEEWGDDVPFTDLVPDPVAHRRRGRSQFDNTQDVQRVKTALFRAVMDNTYQVNEPMVEAVETNILNPDMLINKEHGGVVWSKAIGSVAAITTPPIFDKVFPVIEYWDGVKQGRTGVGRQTMGLDPDALQNQTAEAVRDGRAASETQTEYYARNMAEIGFQRLFTSILKLVVKNQDKPKMIRLRDEWVEMDPRPWNASMDCTINVGLGAGSRDRDMVMLQAIAGKQEQIILNLGPENPLCTLEEYGRTLSEMVQVGGLKSAEKYFKQVTPEAIQQWMQSKAQQPDPKAQELQAKMQMEQQKLQMESQAETQRMQQQAQIETTQAQADIATNNAKVQADMQMAREKFEFDKQLKLMEFQLKEREAERASQERREIAAQSAQAEASKPEPKPAQNDNAGHTALAGALHAIAASMSKPTTIRKGPDGSYTKE